MNNGVNKQQDAMRLFVVVTVLAGIGLVIRSFVQRSQEATAQSKQFWVDWREQQARFATPKNAAQKKRTP